MGSWVADRLGDIGLTLPTVTALSGACVPAVRTGNLVLCSAQLPTVDGELIAVGEVGGTIDLGQAVECARVCALNSLAAIDDVVGVDSVARVVDLVGHVACAPGFVEISAAVDGASDLLHSLFGRAGAHSRSVVGVTVLPYRAPVQIRLTVEVPPVG
jgi:enamine deaminase RidA (YjgF/YER057c/UK114 family)